MLAGTRVLHFDTGSMGVDAFHLFSPASPPAGEHPKTVESMLSGLGVFLRTATYGLDTKPLLKQVRVLSVPKVQT